MGFDPVDGLKYLFPKILPEAWHSQVMITDAFNEVFSEGGMIIDDHLSPMRTRRMTSGSDSGVTFPLSRSRERSSEMRSASSSYAILRSFTGKGTVPRTRKCRRAERPCRPF